VAKDTKSLNSSKGRDQKVMDGRNTSNADGGAQANGVDLASRKSDKDSATIKDGSQPGHVPAATDIEDDGNNMRETEKTMSEDDARQALAGLLKAYPSSFAVSIQTIQTASVVHKADHIEIDLFRCYLKSKRFTYGTWRARHFSAIWGSDTLPVVARAVAKGFVLRRGTCCSWVTRSSSVTSVLRRRSPHGRKLKTVQVLVLKTPTQVVKSSSIRKNAHSLSRARSKASAVSVHGHGGRPNGAGFSRLVGGSNSKFRSTAVGAGKTLGVGRPLHEHTWRCVQIPHFGRRLYSMSRSAPPTTSGSRSGFSLHPLQREPGQTLEATGLVHEAYARQPIARPFSS
jgi:hypothetical protein